ncbi:MAG TPA: nitroreductase/quinone reductase family protein [Solirubrobacteraceae bacterium]|nr:nitroreductase/quinone reductase family protein [Solirubrobacteraceae bacterium]
MAPRAPKLSGWARALSPLIASRAGSWFYLNIAPRIDRRLLPATNGRLSISIGQPVLCLEVRGAKSGQIRRTPLLFTEVDGELVIVASAAGRPHHPAWYHNLRAHPRVKLYAPGGRSGEYVARTVAGEERERMWEAARKLYSGYDAYVDRVAGAREIPVVALRRVSAHR